ncbi:SNF1-related protein kinase regulatory subunit beta-1 isoform X1 [Elaeis guineensis]|uniref:SNF1-related protein kinase regulatory subunit beta-1 isoform X1 n=1 Tax=Elaeis guineensis var. tenera TaxID=51953 RepID=A0A6I9R7M5_ELAGV|nr:SNF1-related protein kinase regulatory subunit beta-1 isoform X1 [Elaeis guineensis]XP_010922103.1 SNF1-related protein kinase regulatory subunit beta-1 isoform X1 [Elaeis guineensis]
MGNASGKDGENGPGGPSARSDGMGSSPPESPGRSRSPFVFTPQIPVAPLQRGAEIPPVFNYSRMNSFHGHLDAPLEKGIPTLITWIYGGNDVAVEGSWDNWSSRKVLQRSGKDHCILLVLPSGVYQYKFIVDGEWRHIPDLPCMTDDMGQTVNLLDVHDYVPENLESVSEFEAPPSPNSSYGLSFPVDEDFAKEPPALPPQMHVTVLGPQSNEDSSKKPQHVLLNHLFIEKGWASQSLVALGLTHRFQSKYVTVVLYKPMRRQ